MAPICPLPSGSASLKLAASRSYLMTCAPVLKGIVVRRISIKNLFMKTVIYKYLLIKKNANLLP